MASKRIVLKKDSPSEVLESWEDFDNSDVLDKGLKSVQLQQNPQLCRLNGTTSTSSNGVVPEATPFKLILNSDDVLNNQYIASQPTVKILKRPTALPTVECQQNGTDGVRVVQPKKTLQQREQEYAEARLRILGESASTAETAEQNDEKYKVQPKVPPPVIYDNTIRAPKGPDGTKGFTLRR